MDYEKKLQQLIGESPKVKVKKFSNWATNQKRNRVLSVEPTTVKEVQAVIRGARQLGLRVRAVGTGHSWTPIFSDEDQVMMHVRNIKRPDGPQIELMQKEDDPSCKLVTMATGVTTGELQKFQVNHGVTLPSNVILRVVQMGSVVSTGSHGTGWDDQTVCDRVVRIRIIDSDGELRQYSLEEDEDLFRAAQCNLGMFGIVVDFTMKLEPMLIVHTEDRWIKVRDLFYNREALKDLVTSNWAVQILWFPFSGISKWEAFDAFMERDIDCGEWKPKDDPVWIRVVNIPEKPGDIKGEEYYREMSVKEFSQARGYDLVDSFIRTYPHVAPTFLRTQVNNLMNSGETSRYQHLPNSIHFRDAIELVPVNDMEWAFAIEEDFSNVCTATQKVIELVHKEALEGRFPINLPLEMRFLKDSDAYMSPGTCANTKYGGTGYSCFIEVLSVQGTPGFTEDFMPKVASIWKNLRNARPHWCKQWDTLDGIDDVFRKAYAQTMPKFKAAISRSGVDPDGMFLTERLQKIFYPEGHPGRELAIQGRKEMEAKEPTRWLTCNLL